MDFRSSLRNARRVSVEHKGPGCCAYCLMAGAFCTVFVMVLIGLAITGVGIAKLVMGGLYFHDCDLQPLIPIFLIVDACVAFLLGCKCQCGGQGGEGEEGNTVGKMALKVVVGLFQLAWLICGTIWVVNVRDVIYSPGHCADVISPTSTAQPMNGSTSTAQPMNGSTSTAQPMNGSLIMAAITPAASTMATCLTCAEAIVDFTFGIVIFQWALFGLVFVVIFFSFLKGCCTA